MVQCEMCGAETASPKTVKVEGAELDVCDQCADFGTEVRTQESSTTATKYSTSSDGSSATNASGAGSGSSTGSSAASDSRRRDMFDDMDELAQDYDDRIRRARESNDLSQSELADELNEKASLIRKLERGDTLPDDTVQRKLERFLDIELSGTGGADDSEWESEASPGSYTLGDMVERKD